MIANHGNRTFPLAPEWYHPDSMVMIRAVGHINHGTVNGTPRNPQRRGKLQIFFCDTLKQPRIGIILVPAAKQRWSYFVGQVGGVFKVESRFNNYAAIA